MKPIIGIAAHPTLQERNHGIIQSCGENYLKSVEKAGGIPLILPIYEEPGAIEKYVSMCDGFLIPGGIDVNPLSYGEGPHPLLQMTRLEYDSYEIRLIQEIYKSGTLWQDVSLRPDPTFRHQQKEMDSCCVSHKVLIEKDSILHSLFGSELLTNSYHHQSVRETGRGLKVTARAQDGVVEALEADGDYPFLLALQWHPECFVVLENNPMAPVFAKLIEACE